MRLLVFPEIGGKPMGRCLGVGGFVSGRIAERMAAIARS